MPITRSGPRRGRGELGDRDRRRVRGEDRRARAAPRRRRGRAAFFASAFSTIASISRSASASSSTGVTRAEHLARLGAALLVQLARGCAAIALEAALDGPGLPVVERDAASRRPPRPARCRRPSGRRRRRGRARSSPVEATRAPRARRWRSRRRRIENASTSARITSPITILIQSPRASSLTESSAPGIGQQARLGRERAPSSSADHAERLVEDDRLVGRVDERPRRRDLHLAAHRPLDPLVDDEPVDDAGDRSRGRSP